MMKTLGEAAFENYSNTMRGRGAKGKKLGKWKDLPDEQKAQWEKGALKLAKTVSEVQASRRRN